MRFRSQTSGLSGFGIRFTVFRFLASRLSGILLCQPLDLEILCGLQELCEVGLCNEVKVVKNCVKKRGWLEERDREILLPEFQFKNFEVQNGRPTSKKAATINKSGTMVTSQFYDSFTWAMLQLPL